MQSWIPGVQPRSTDSLWLRQVDDDEIALVAAEEAYEATLRGIAKRGRLSPPWTFISPHPAHLLFLAARKASRERAHGNRKD